MAAQEYYDSFNRPASAAPSYTSQPPQAPPPYQPFPHGPAASQVHLQSHNAQAPPVQEYGWKPTYAEYHDHAPQVHFEDQRPQGYAPQQAPPQAQRPPQQPPRPSNASTQHLAIPNRLRPSRSHSEPPSPDDYHHSSRPRPHSRHHSHNRRRSRSRSRERDHDRRRDHDRGGADAQRARSKTTSNTFLGALGGSVIGDLIFPGLGTVGGALLGGVGGHEASKRKDGKDSRRGHSEAPRRRRHKSYEEEWDEGRRRRGER